MSGCASCGHAYEGRGPHLPSAVPGMCVACVAENFDCAWQECIPADPQVGEIWLAPRGDVNEPALILADEEGMLTLRFMEDDVIEGGVPWDYLEPDGGFEEPIGPERR